MKPLPLGLSFAGDGHARCGDDVEFLHDVTYAEDNRRVAEQMIFDRVLALIRGAEDLVVADLFLFNDHRGKETGGYRPLSRELVEALLEKKRSRPGIAIVVITDPVNEVYGGSPLPGFVELRAAGIPVVATKLEALRDSNAIYSAFWRLFVRWSGSAPGGWLPHPFAKNAGGVGLRAWLALLNFKANHRKVIIADAPARDGDREMVGMVMSANPHDGSSAHGNVALLVRGGGLWRDLLRSEQAVLNFSAPQIDLASSVPAYARDERVERSTGAIRVTANTAAGENPAGAATTRDVTVRLVTEKKIRAALLAQIGKTQRGDAIDVAMFYLSERRIIGALLAAAARDVSIRVLLDPNRDAFGYKKNGIPNRPVAAELRARSHGKISIRWYDTHGEQFHTKMVLVRRGSASGETAVLFAGSANLTRRNIGDFNLETDVEVAGNLSAPVLRSAAGYFERLWTNDGHRFSLPFEAYRDDSLLKRWIYRVQERTGLGTF